MKLFRVYSKESSNLIKEFSCEKLSSGMLEIPIGSLAESYFQVGFGGEKFDALLYDVFEVVSGTQELRQVPLHEKIIK